MQSTKLAPFTVWFHQSGEFHTIKREIFGNGVYYTELATSKPVIIDAGAHIGLATLYFKKMYPDALIYAIEPLEENYKILQKNVFENQLQDIELINAALTDSGSRTIIHLDRSPIQWWSTAGREEGAWNHQQQTSSRQVPAIQLSDLLQRINQSVDLLKLDIEGSEQHVLKEARSYLGKVKNIIIEFHPIKTQSLRQILTILENAGFSVELWQDGKPISATKVRGLVYIHATKNP